MEGRKMTDSLMLSPITIGNMRLKNRFVVPAMATNYCDHDGYATDRYIDYHRTKAQGGWGLIITENYAVAPEGRGLWVPGLWEDEQIAGHRKLTDVVHESGAKIIAQIYHAGRQTSSVITGSPLVAPSAIPCPVMQEMPREMTKEEIKQLIRNFEDTAARAREAGFDGVEIHLGHGYLLAGFLSLYSNKRTDEYGGSLRNRARVPLQIYDAIRDRCGEEFAITCRISADEFVPGGRTIEETKVLATMFENAGFDAIHVSAGVYASTELIMQPMYVPSGFMVELAAEVKKVVDIPVIAVGRINDPEMAETVLLSGKADLISMGRASLADPQLPKKYAEGRAEDIKTCIACQQGCKGIVGKGEPIRCLVNPSLGFEYLKEAKLSKRKKRVSVIGGGVAGMEAALAAADAGHEVTLYEKSERLGGQFELAAIPPAKGIMSTLITWERKQIDKKGITVHTGTEYTMDIFEKEMPEAVILCTGAVPNVPGIPGIDKSHVVLAQDVLSGRTALGERIIVAGGGMIGAETADYLASLGKNVTIIEMLPQIAADEEESRKLFLMRALKEEDVRIMTDTRIIEITDNGIVVDNADGRMVCEADQIVIALGMVAYHALEGLLKEKVEVHVVGDAMKVRNALEAVREGYLAGYRV